MTIPKKRKRILLIAIPAVVAVAAAAVVLWLVLGRGTPQVLEPVYNQATGELMHYTILEGAPKEEEDRPLPLPLASFTPPEGWTQTLDAAAYADRFSIGYQDIYQSTENDYTTLTFSQQYGVEGSTVDGGQQVQFGDRQVIYRQEPESSDDLGYHTQVQWVEGPTLFTLSCRYGPAMDLNQMLELVSRVDTQSSRQPIHSPLSLAKGSNNSFLIRDTYLQNNVAYTRSEGNPEIPADAQFLSFTPPEGYQLSQMYEENNNSGRRPDFHTSGYYHSEDNQDWLYFDCTLGSNACRTNGNPGSFDGQMAYADPQEIQDAQVNGNPAFVYLGPDRWEIAWIDGYYSLLLSSSTPRTADQLIALAETVE